MPNRKIPVVLLQIEGGVIHEMDSTDPVRIVVLDADTEGGDDANVHLINGAERYVHDVLLEGAELNPDYVLDLAYQVERAAGGAPEVDEVENPTERWQALCAKQGWSAESQITHLEGFLRSRVLLEEFVLYAEAAADAENAEG